MPTTPVQGFRYPAPSDPADGPAALRNLAEDAETHSVMRFTRPADRAAKLPAPVAGMLSWVDDPGRLEVYQGALGAGGWRDITSAGPASVDDIAFPWVIAHRGGALLAPENTLPAFRAAAATGFVGVEPDVHLAGRVPFCMHDAGLARTTDGDGFYYHYTPWQLARLTVDAANWFGGGWPNLPGGVPLLEDVIRAVGGHAILVPHAKVNGAGQHVTLLLQRYGLTRSAIVQADSLAELAAPAAAGIECMHIAYTEQDIIDPATLLARGIRWVGYSTQIGGDRIQQALTAGLKVVIHTVNRHWVRDLGQSVGVHGWFSDDPLYLQPDPGRYRLAFDRFDAGGWPHGHQATLGGRGSFPGGDWWRPDPAVPKSFCLMGGLCPVPNPTSYTISVDYRTDIAGTDASRWGAVAFGAPTDVGWTDTGAPGDDGYHLLIRANGQLALFKRAAGTLTAGPALNTPAIPVGQPITITVRTTPTDIVATRLDAPAPNSLTWADTQFRGPYLHLGTNPLTAGFTCSFRNLTIT